MILVQKPEQLDGLQIQLTNNKKRNNACLTFFFDTPHYLMVVRASQVDSVGPAAATPVKTWPAEQKWKKILGVVSG